MKKILIPTNFTHTSYDAIDYAVHFLKNKKTTFYFLNTYEYQIHGTDALLLLHADDESFTLPRTNSILTLKKLVHKYTYNNRNSNHKFDLISSYGSLVNVINENIEKYSIDLVVLSQDKNLKKGIPAYGKIAKSIIENVRLCPVMVLPNMDIIKNGKEFILLSNFENELPVDEIKNWYKLVKMVNGVIKVVALSYYWNMTKIQRNHLENLKLTISRLTGQAVIMEFIQSEEDLQFLLHMPSENVLCLMDSKPDLWRYLGLTHSHITNLGPLASAPLIALHR